MTKMQQARQDRLLPNGIPRYVRCYDNGGKTCDRYTVVFSKKSITESRPFWYAVLGMSGAPFHPQGVGLHSEYERLIDTIAKDGGYCWPPAIGKKNHLGKRIRFEDLPADCRELTLRDYKELWDLK